MTLVSRGMDRTQLPHPLLALDPCLPDPPVSLKSNIARTSPFTGMNIPGFQRLLLPIEEVLQYAPGWSMRMLDHLELEFFRAKNDLLGSIMERAPERNAVLRFDVNYGAEHRVCYSSDLQSECVIIALPQESAFCNQPAVLLNYAGWLFRHEMAHILQKFSWQVREPSLQAFFESCDNIEQCMDVLAKRSFAGQGESFPILEVPCADALRATDACDEAIHRLFAAPAGQLAIITAVLDAQADACILNQASAEIFAQGLYRACLALWAINGVRNEFLNSDRAHLATLARFSAITQVLCEKLNSPACETDKDMIISCLLSLTEQTPDSSFKTCVLDRIAAGIEQLPEQFDHCTSDLVTRVAWDAHCNLKRCLRQVIYDTRLDLLKLQNIRDKTENK